MAFRRRQRYHKIESFDYKDVDTLRKFINERGKIVSRR
ncbi:30S ribosomal protein S18, partial [Candidatus Poribacteria bacterium]